jgi:hypothetical protein
MSKETQEILEKRTGIVRLVGTDQKYHTSPVYITPKFEEVTKTFYVGDKSYKGKVESEDNEKVVVADGTPIRLTDHDSFRFAHLQTFNMESEEQRFLLELALADEMVASSKDEINPGVHRFYIEDKEKEADSKISKNQRVFLAMEKLRSMSLEEMQDYGRLLQIFTRDMSRAQLEAALYDLALLKPMDILNVSEDKNSKHKIFLRKLVQADILKLVNGKYMSGNELVGANEDFAIEFMRDSSNNALITQWNKILKSSEPQAATTKSKS